MSIRLSIRLSIQSIRFLNAHRMLKNIIPIKIIEISIFEANAQTNVHGLLIRMLFQKLFNSPKALKITLY